MISALTTLLERYVKRCRIGSAGKPAYEGQLAAAILFVVAGAFFIATALLVTPFSRWEKQAATAELARQHVRLIRSVQKVHRADSYPEVISLIKNLMVASPLSGAVLLNNQYQVFKSVGQAPSGRFREFRQGRVTFTDVNNGDGIDLYLRKAETGLPYHIVVRISTATINARLEGQFERALKFLAVLLIVTSAGAGAVLYWVLVRPLGLLQSTLAGSSPAEQSCKFPDKLLTRGDLVGNLARAIARRSGALRPGARTQTSAHAGRAGDLIDDIPFMVISFNARGRVSGANESALWFFQCKSLAELQGRDLCVFQVEDSLDATQQCLPDLLRDGSMDLSVVVQCRDEPVSCRIVAHAEHDETGEMRNLVVCLLPPDRHSEGSDEASPQDQSSAQDHERQVLVLKLQLEACLTLISSPNTKVIMAAAQPIRTDLLVEGWYMEASRAGLIDRTMEHNVPGQVVGDDETVQSLMRHALTFIALRSEAELPVLAASGSVLSADVVEFIFEEVGGMSITDQENTKPANSHPAASLPEDWILSLAALSKLLAAYGGKVRSTRGEDNANLVRFTMRARPVSAAGQLSQDQKDAA